MRFSCLAPQPLAGGNFLGALLMGLHFREALGHHEGAFQIGFTQVTDDHTAAAAGGMDHFAASRVNAHMVDMAPPGTEKEEISGAQFGKIQGVCHCFAFPDLLGTGAGQFNVGIVVNKLHQSRTIGGTASLEGTAQAVRGTQIMAGFGHDLIREIMGYRLLDSR